MRQRFPGFALDDIRMTLLNCDHRQAKRGTEHVDSSERCDPSMELRVLGDHGKPGEGTVINSKWVTLSAIFVVARPRVAPCGRRFPSIPSDRRVRHACRVRSARPELSVDALARREPVGTLHSQLGLGALLVFRTTFRGERVGDRTYKLPSSTTSEPGRYVKSLGDPVTGKGVGRLNNRY